MIYQNVRMISPEVWLPPYTPFDHPLSPQNFFTSWPLILNHDLEVCLATRLSNNFIFFPEPFIIYSRGNQNDWGYIVPGLPRYIVPALPRAVWVHCTRSALVHCTRTAPGQTQRAHSCHVNIDTRTFSRKKVVLEISADASELVLFDCYNLPSYW